MDDVATTVEALLRGGADLSAVALGDAPAVAEALAEVGAAGLLTELAEKVLPRLVKKERFDAIEEIWLACCTAEALPVPLLLRTAERVAARGEVEVAGALLGMLADTLVGAARAQEALALLEQGLEWAATKATFDAAAEALAAVFPDARAVADAVAGLRRGGEGGAADDLRRAQRALRYAPGVFLQWPDGAIGQVAKTDGATVVIRHPSGSTELRPVDETPPPRVLAADAHAVLRLYAPAELEGRWRAEPTESLVSLLAEQGGWIRVPGLQNILVPRVMDERRFEETLAVLKVECGLGRDERPSYDPHRRLFVARGAVAPETKRRPVTEGRPGEEKRRAGRPASRVAASAVPPAPLPTPPDAALGVVGEGARWVDLTALSEVRALISHVEGDVESLNKELNTELPARLEEARAHGDLKENAEYDAAKDRLRFVQARIAQLQAWLGQLHELARVRLVPGRVTAMSVVTLSEEATGRERRLRLVPAELLEPQPGDVSVGTPYGRALLGKKAGDVVVVTLPRRTEKLEILRVVDPDRA